MKNDDLALPEETGADLAHTLAKVALGYIPVVGPAVAEFFGVLVLPPIARRQQQWMERVAEGHPELTRQRPD
jgi:hypothetical protein